MFGEKKTYQFVCWLIIEAVSDDLKKAEVDAVVKFK